MEGEPTSHITIPEEGPMNGETAEPTSTAASTSTTETATASADAASETNGGQNTTIHAPTPTRPRLPNRKSSGTIIVPRDSEEASRPIETQFEPGDVRAMSPRRTDEDIKQLGQETRDEMRKHAKLLQDSLLLIFHRIQAVKEEHDKLDSNNKFLQKYIGDLMSTSKITSTGNGRGKK